MGSKQNPHHDHYFEQRNECDSKKRVVERFDHAQTLLTVKLVG
jgi:hypothetical protein